MKDKEQCARRPELWCWAGEGRAAGMGAEVGQSGGRPLLSPLITGDRWPPPPRRNRGQLVTN